MKRYVSPLEILRQRTRVATASTLATSTATHGTQSETAKDSQCEVSSEPRWLEDGGAVNDNDNIPRKGMALPLVVFSKETTPATLAPQGTEETQAARSLSESAVSSPEDTELHTVSEVPLHADTSRLPGEEEVSSGNGKRIPTIEEVYQEMLDLRADLFAKIHKMLRLRSDEIDKFVDTEQLRAAATACRFLCHDREPSGALRHSVQCIAPTGAGKTAFYGMVLYYCRMKCPEHFPPNKLAIILAPKAVVDSNQIGIEFSKFGNIMLNTIVASLPSMRASLGDAFMEWRTVVVNDQPVVYPFWNPLMYPCIIFVDESQGLKNEESDQSKVIESASVAGIPVLVGSATPYSRIKQAKVIACALRPNVEFGGNKCIPLDVNIWPSWSSQIAHPKDPSEWSPSALRRLQEWLEPHTVRFTCTYPHKIIVKASLARFATIDEEERYMATMIELDRIREERGKNPLEGFIRELVAINKHCQTAEEIGAPHMVDAMLGLFQARERTRLKGSFILGFSNRTALEIAAETLRAKGVSDNEIARIHGGQPDRARHVDRFKKDRAPFCLLTISAGGAGLDLGHNQFNRRQRFMIARACWNDIQFAQLAGRCHRRNSLSATYLYIVAFEGTEEMRRLNKLLRKTRSLKEVITAVQNSSTSTQGAASFFDASNDLEVERATAMIVQNGDDESEDAAAEAVIGTKATLEYTTEDED